MTKLTIEQENTLNSICFDYTYLGVNDNGIALLSHISYRGESEINVGNYIIEKDGSLKKV